ncbi:MAG TPA: PDZ domain-containing protein, partial [Gemmatimonadaceae bacterium]|nr:PDZ domain-containing protein [Gemmatimonadaceae bacterium]
LNGQVTPSKHDSTCTNYPDGHVECRVFRRGVPGDSLLRRTFYRMDSAMAKRAALGLELRTTGTKRDTLGVFVDAVTPKGPAETAGIIEGDRIASINGVDLRTSAADTEDSYTNGLAAHRLSREVQKLSPGARVTLRVYSGGRFRDVQVTAGKASDIMRFGNRFRYGGPGMGGMMEFDGPGTMMFGPEMPMLRERLEPLMKGQMDPMLRERLMELPNRIQLRAPLRIKTLAPTRVRARRNYRVDRGAVGDRREMHPPVMITAVDLGTALVEPANIPDFAAQPFLEAIDIPDFEELFLDFGDEPFDFEKEIVPVSPDEIRELVGTTILSAQSALKHLAAAGIA